MTTFKELKEHCEKTIGMYGGNVSTNTYLEHSMVLDLIKEHENRPKHDSELLDKVAEKIHKKMCSENCGERQCIDSMDRCVWYGYIDEAIEELKSEIKE